MIFKDREIEDIMLDGVDHNDAPDYCDAFIYGATWSDSGEELNDKELDELNNDSDLVYELVVESLY